MRKIKFWCPHGGAVLGDVLVVVSRRIVNFEFDMIGD